jgi:hypothetical protein
MSWAARRRLIILIILGAVTIAFVSILFISVVSKAPSCSDMVQNQDESGVDCGGPCAYLCLADVQPPVVLFTKALPNTLGRTDVIAMVENKNPRAFARAVPYRISLFGKDQTLIQEVSGTVDLPPGISVPVYVPGIVSGQQVADRAFLSIDEFPRWQRISSREYLVPTISEAVQTGGHDSPRIDAEIRNPSTTPLFRVVVIAMVRDTDGNIIAASQTIVPSIEPYGREPVVFTWNTAFSAPVAIIDIVPIIQRKE